MVNGDRRFSVPGTLVESESFRADTPVTDRDSGSDSNRVRRQRRWFKICNGGPPLLHTSPERYASGTASMLQSSPADLPQEMEDEADQGLGR
jgi:hypothetical protein